MESTDSEKPPKPCEYFDMIAGSGTGGLIAILLGRLCMSITDAIEAYTLFAQMTSTLWHDSCEAYVTSKDDLPPTNFSYKLNGALKMVLQGFGLNPNTSFLNNYSDGCRTFVTATSTKFSRTVFLRSYHAGFRADPFRKGNEETLATIVEAVSATLTVSSHFCPMSIGSREFTSGGIAHNNPIKQLLHEANKIWGNKNDEVFIKCIVSIGYGRISQLDPRSLKPVERVVSAIAQETEMASDEVMDQPLLLQMPFYFRFGFTSSITPIVDEMWLVDEQDSFIAEFLQLKQLLLSSCAHQLSNSLSPNMKLGRRQARYLLYENCPSQDDEMYVEALATNLYKSSDLGPILREAFASMNYQEFQNEFTLLLKGPEEIQGDSRLAKFTYLQIIAKRGKMVARALWLRIIDAQPETFQADLQSDLNLPEFGRTTGELEPAQFKSSSHHWDDVNSKMSRTEAEIRPLNARSRNRILSRSEGRLVRPWNQRKSENLQLVAERQREIENQMHQTYSLIILRETNFFQDLIIRTKFMALRSFFQLAAYENNQAAISQIFNRYRLPGLLETPASSALKCLLDSLDPSKHLSAQGEFDLDSPIESDTSSRRKGKGDRCQMLICGWEFPRVLTKLDLHPTQENFDTGDTKWHEHMRGSMGTLQNMVVLTGHGDLVQAATCGEVVNQICGSRIGENFLKTLLYAASGYLVNAPQILQPPAPPSYLRVLRVTDKHIMLLLDHPSIYFRILITRALTWLCQALRLAPESSSTKLFQSATWKALDYERWPNDGVTAYVLKPLVEIKQASVSNCWRKLFKSGVVSKRLIHREWGSGLELPFSMMVELAAVENYAWISDNADPPTAAPGGYLLHGFYTALIPTQYNAELESIQWHFESDENHIIHPSQLQTTQNPWFKCQDHRLFESCKSFVGWCETANIMLGTRELTNMVEWSGLPSRASTLHRKGITAIGQFGLSGAIPIQATIQLGTEYAYVNNVQNFSAGRSYAKAIEETSRQVALVFDSAAGKAWLVPKVSLLLHLCHRSFTYYQDAGPNAVDPIPFATPSCDGSRAACGALYNNGDVVVRRHGTNEVDKTLLRHVLVDINANISDTSRIRELPNKATLFGSELMTMVAKPGIANGLAEMTSKEASNSWFGLVEHVDAVFVCSNLGPAIQPALPAAAATCQCVELPEKKQYLAAHLWCLDVILQRRGSRLDQLSTEVFNLDKDYFWHLSGQPFRVCQHTHQQSSYWTDMNVILQTISKRNLLSPKSTSRPVSTPPPVTGAVIFGSNPSQGWLARIMSMEI